MSRVRRTLSPPPSGPSTPAPAAAPPVPPYPYPYYPGYAPPPPQPKESHAALIIVIVVIVVIVGAVIAVGLYIVSTMFQNFTTRPFVSFGIVSQVNGNASVRVDSVSTVAAASSFRVRLTIGSSTGTDQPLAASGAPAMETVNAVTYLITWVDTDASGSITVGDTFRVSGNGVALPSGQTFVFYMDWANGGVVSGPSGVASWST